VDWTPETIRPMRKALLSSHKAQVEAVLKPFHVSLQASNRNDLGTALFKTGPSFFLSVVS